jgi:hypothetical protein
MSPSLVVRGQYGLDIKMVILTLRPSMGYPNKTALGAELNHIVSTISQSQEEEAPTKLRRETSSIMALIDLTILNLTMLIM